MSKYKTQNFPASFNSFKAGEHPVFKGFFERAITSNKSNNIDGYLEMIGDYFDGVHPYNTVGYGRRTAPFQWVATSVVFEGYDDAYQGIGWTPLEAVRNLYHAIGADYPEESL
jgi:hypothetical protein